MKLNKNQFNFLLWLFRGLFFLSFCSLRFSKKTIHDFFCLCEIFFCLDCHRATNFCCLSEFNRSACSDECVLSKRRFLLVRKRWTSKSTDFQSKWDFSWLGIINLKLDLNKFEAGSQFYIQFRRGIVSKANAFNDLLNNHRQANSNPKQLVLKLVAGGKFENKMCWQFFQCDIHSYFDVCGCVWLTKISQRFKLKYWRLSSWSELKAAWIHSGRFFLHASSIQVTGFIIRT